MSITVSNNEVLRNSNKVVTPTTQSKHVSVLFGINSSATGADFIPIAIDSNGALIVATSVVAGPNLTHEYTYNADHFPATEKIYETGAAAGSSAKLITYTYSGSDLIKKEMTDATV